MSFECYQSRVNQQLDQYLQNNNALTEAMRYSVLVGGKRFRAILTYTTGQLFSTDLDFLDSSACAIELIHAYSLIHDDLPAMDDDEIRHNQPASHKAFGEAHAILAGDALQSLAFDILARDSHIEADVRIRLIKALTSAAFDMAEGQAIDLSVVGKKITVEDLAKMHRKKTGALLTCAVEMGALLSSDCKQKDKKRLLSFAQAIGLAYQIQDDVLDIESPSEVLGKKQNSDSEKGKPTYPGLIGLEESKKSFMDLYQEALGYLKDLSVDAEPMIKLTNKLMQRQF